MDVQHAATAPAAPSRRFFWIAFAASCVLLALLPVAPSVQDGALSNLSPVILGWLVLVMEPSAAPAFLALWLGAHLLASFALALLIVQVRRRIGARRFRRAAVASVVLVACGGAWLVHECWPDKIFFDASNIDYDVSDLVEPSQGARFPDAEAVAASIRDGTAGKGPHYIPDRVMGVADEPRIIAWGSWPEHFRLRRELAKLRQD